MDKPCGSCKWFSTTTSSPDSGSCKRIETYETDHRASSTDKPLAGIESLGRFEYSTWLEVKESFGCILWGAKEAANG